MRTDGLFQKGEHPTPEMRAKIKAGVIRHYREHPRPLSPKNAALEKQAQENLKALHEQHLALQAQAEEAERLIEERRLKTIMDRNGNRG